MAPGGLGICRNTKMRELDFQTFTPLGDLQSSSWFMKNVEIVGNIFDNPELAGGER